MENTPTLHPILSFIIGILPFVGIVLVWFLNEIFKRREERRKKQEERYVSFLESLVGFSAYTHDSKAKSEFINQLNLAWLYCPDHILHKCYEFINAVHGDTQTSNDYRLQIVSELVLCFRMELYGKRTKMKSKHFQFLKST